MLAIGVGTAVDEKELDTIATDPDSQNVFRAATFDSLKSLKGLLAAKACERKLYWQLQQLLGMCCAVYTFRKLFILRDPVRLTGRKIQEVTQNSSIPTPLTSSFITVLPYSGYNHVELLRIGAVYMIVIIIIIISFVKIRLLPYPPPPKKKKKDQQANL